jgi:hypothetical protein
MMTNKDVYTKAIESLSKTQMALLNEISIADGRARLHAPTFHYVSMAIAEIKALQEQNTPKEKAKEVAPKVTAAKKAA